MALFPSRSTIPSVGKGALRNLIQSSGISDGEVGESIRFGARHNESSESQLHMPRLSKICEIGRFRGNWRFRGRWRHGRNILQVFNKASTG